MNDTMPTNDNPGTQPAESEGEFDYESLLEEHKEGTKPETRPEPRPDPAVRQLLKEFKPIAEVAEKHLRTEAAEQEQKIVQEAVGAVKEGEALAGVSDAIVEGFLNLQYIRNPDFKAAFDAREESPANWNAALVGARESLEAEMSSMTTMSEKDDTEAALAAVKGTSQTELSEEAVNPKELFAMSEQDFAEYKRNLGS